MTRKRDTAVGRLRPWTAVATRTLPTALLAAAGVCLAWQTRGSTAAADWLPYAAGAALLAAAVLLGAVARPSRGAACAVVALAGLAAWMFVSHWWSASPSLARDEALLTALYTVALLVPVVTLRTGTERVAAAAIVGLAATGLALADTIALLLVQDPAARFVEGRLAFPISYINAQAAAFVLGFWPAVGLAAHRRLPRSLRAGAAGAATLDGAAALLCQSKGAELGLGLSVLVVAAASRGRLRLLVPAVLAIALDAAFVAPLTAPYRASPADLGGSVRHAAVAALLAGAAGILAGAVYAVADRRLELSPGAIRLAGRIAGAAAALAAVAAVAAFLLVPAHPLGYLQGRWQTFKTPPATDTGSSHLLSLGSYRYDTWRVALDEWRRHPVAGIGARGFAPAYLVRRHIDRTPQHAHSLELETLSDEGAIGFVLLALGIGLPFAAAVAGARRRLLPSAIAVGACSAWLLQASADWLWSLPAIGIPFFLLLGIGASWTNESTPLAPRVRNPAAAACVALLVVGLIPAWVAARLVTRALHDPAGAASDLRWARRLDPLSTQVLVTRAAVARTYGEQVEALRTAVRMEPRQAPLHYLLGVVELNGGHNASARAELHRALELDPGDPLVESTLARVPKG